MHLLFRELSSYFRQFRHIAEIFRIGLFPQLHTMFPPFVGLEPYWGLAADVAFKQTSVALRYIVGSHSRCVVSDRHYAHVIAPAVQFRHIEIYYRRPEFLRHSCRARNHRRRVVEQHRYVSRVIVARFLVAHKTGKRRDALLAASQNMPPQLYNSKCPQE